MAMTRSRHVAKHMEAKIKHLEFIQSTINRMAGNSFLLKGWAVTLVGALFALTFKEVDPMYLLISLIVLVLFWRLDSYYLSRERLFIKLYECASASTSDTTDFSMNPKPFEKYVTVGGCAFSETMRLFYGGLAVAHIIIFILI